MNEKVKKYLEDYCKKNDWDSDEEGIFELLMETDAIYREEVSEHRWWNEYRYVIDVDGVLIGFIYAEANRDESMADLGYEFDWSSVCEMRSVEKTITAYEKVSESH